MVVDLVIVMMVMAGVSVVRRLVMGDTGNSNGRMDTKSGDIDENTMGLRKVAEGLRKHLHIIRGM